jgi:hypothetical protein
VKLAHLDLPPLWPEEDFRAGWEIGFRLSLNKHCFSAGQTLRQPGTVGEKTRLSLAPYFPYLLRFSSVIY